MKDTYILCMKLQRKVFIYKKKKSMTNMTILMLMISLPKLAYDFQ